jgi:NDP-sugar pyrophosphorylase family protein
MQIVILAAGSGSRLHGYHKSFPKSIIPAFEGGKTLLSSLLHSLISNSGDRITIIVGFHADQMIEYITSNFDPNLIQIVEAASVWQKGPIYSLLAAEELLQLHPFFSLLPADILFTDKFIQFFLQTGKVLKEVHSLHIFTYSSRSKPSSGNYCIDEERTQNDGIKIKIVPISLWDTTVFPQSHDYNVLIPAMLIPSSYLFHAKEFVKNGGTTVFDLIKKQILLGNPVKVHHFSGSEFVFHDFDTLNDFARSDQIAHYLGF